MSLAFPRLYNSFADFEREELRKLDSLRTTIDDMLEERFSEDLGDSEGAPRRRRGRPRKNA
ncbi:MAG TPA: hypothetical protein VK698_00645 [Kofleriaceae bacterium]|nr:hypothetical protein [Kofleriaceae bacterium]